MIERIVSGGQTGADRGALDAAIACGVPHGGWCPLGRVAEDGRIPDRYQLMETETSSYLPRTKRNVKHSDGTAILTIGELSGGSAATAYFARRHRKPCLHLRLDCRSDADAAEQLRAFVTEHGIRTLNVAGPRASNEPGIHARCQSVLTVLLGEPSPKT